VRFSEPVLEAASVVGGVVHFSSIVSTTANNFAAAVQQAGGTPSLQGITTGTNTVIFPPGIPGNYLLQASVSAATSATALTAFTGGTGLNLLTQTTRDSVSSQVSVTGAGTGAPSFVMLTQAVSVPAGGATLTLGASTLVGTGCMDLWIISLPATVLTAQQREEVEIEDLQSELAEMRDQVAEMRAFMLSHRPDPSASSSSSVTSSNLRVNTQEAKSESDLESPLTGDADLGKSVKLSASMASRLSRVLTGK